MAKKPKTEAAGEVDTLAGFDNLSREEFVNGFIQENGHTTTSNTTGKEPGAAFESTGDKEADKILKAAASKEKAAKIVQKKIAVPAGDELEEEDPAEEVEEEETEEPAEEETTEEEPSEEESEETEEEAEEEEADEETPEAKKKREDADKITADKKKAADLKAKKDKSKKASEDNDAPLTFEDDNTAAPGKSSDVEDLGWKGLAKELFNTDLESDDFDKFKEVVEKHADYNIGKFKPETQRLFKFTEAGGTIEDFIEPLSKIDAALMENDYQIAERSLIAKGFKDVDKRAKKLEAMEESGDLEVEANAARETLKTYRDQVRERIIDERIKAQEKYESRQKEAPQKESAAIKAVLTSKKEFMGTVLQDGNRERITKKYAEGVYEKAFKDPEQIAEYLLFLEYGKAGIENLKTAAKREARIKYLKDRHKVPPTGGKLGQVRSTGSGKDSEGNWDLLEKEQVKK